MTGVDGVPTISEVQDTVALEVCVPEVDVKTGKVCVATSVATELVRDVGFVASELAVEMEWLDREVALEVVRGTMVLVSSLHDEVVMSVSAEDDEGVPPGVGLVSNVEVNVLVELSHNVVSRERLVDVPSDLVVVAYVIVLGVIVAEFGGVASSHGGSVMVVEVAMDEMDDPTEPEDFVESHDDEDEWFQAPRDVVGSLYVCEKEIVGGICEPVLVEVTLSV